MSTSESAVKDILSSAIQREIDAHNLYSSLADKVEVPPAKEILTDLAAQELGHRRRLESLLEGRKLNIVTKAQQKKVVDLKITDYLIEVPLAEDSDVQDILIVAGKREKASHDLYAALGKVVEDEETVKLFDFLANEELRHKNRVETLYEEIILTWN